MKKRFLLLFLLSLLSVTAVAAEYRGIQNEIPPGTLQVTQVKLKHGGDCYIVIAPDHTVSVIDTGVKNDMLLSTLRRMNIKKIRQVIISHPHSDHWGALAELLAEPSIQVDRVLKSPLTAEDIEAVIPKIPPDMKYYRWNARESTAREVAEVRKYEQEIAEAAQQRNIPIVEIDKGKNLDFGGGVTASILFGTRREELTGMSIGNNNSLVFRLEYNDFSMLFTGDMMIDDQEQALLATGIPLQSDVLKAGHHSLRSCGDEFIRAVQPQVALISLPRQDRDSKPTCTRFDKHNIPHFTAYLFPEITVVSDGATFHLSMPGIVDQ